MHTQGLSAVILDSLHGMSQLRARAGFTNRRRHAMVARR
jgi:hypothetical protein